MGLMVVRGRYAGHYQRMPDGVFFFIFAVILGWLAGDNRNLQGFPLMLRALIHSAPPGSFPSSLPRDLSDDSDSISGSLGVIPSKTYWSNGEQPNCDLAQGCLKPVGRPEFTLRIPRAVRARKSKSLRIIRTLVRCGLSFAESPQGNFPEWPPCGLA
jgi:hypothetical protein